MWSLFAKKKEIVDFFFFTPKMTIGNLFHFATICSTTQMAYSVIGLLVSLCSSQIVIILYQFSILAMLVAILFAIKRLIMLYGGYYLILRRNVKLLAKNPTLTFEMAIKLNEFYSNLTCCGWDGKQISLYLPACCNLCMNRQDYASICYPKNVTQSTPCGRSFYILQFSILPIDILLCICILATIMTFSFRMLLT